MKSLRETLFGTDEVWKVLPGAATALVVMLLAAFANRALGALLRAHFQLEHSPVSTFLLAIILGVAARNLIPFPAVFEPGFRFCVAKLLRLGIILLGIRLSVVAVAKIGLVALVVVVVCIAAGLLLTRLFARLFGVPRRLGTLVAAGTAICGVSAIIATAPAIGAREEETAYAVSTITLFGLVATLAYPYLAELVLHLNEAQAGIFLGTAVHDTSQVTGAAFIYDQVWSREISKIAITTKLVRNTFLMAVIPILSILYARQEAGALGAARPGAAGSAEPADGGGSKSLAEVARHRVKAGVLRHFPLFVLGFLALALFRSAGDLAVEGEAGRFLFWAGSGSWAAFHGWVKGAAEVLLTLAIAGAGLSTQLARLRTLTLKPFLVGLISAAAVGVTSLLLVTLLRTPIRALLVF